MEEIQKTFSACSDIEKFDERHFIDEVIKSRNIEAKYIYPSPEQMVDHLDSLIWYQDEPFASTSVFAQWLVFRLASENGVEVMLDGQGSDEQLCGYHRFFGCRYAYLFKSLNFSALLSEMHQVNNLHGDSVTQSLMMLGFYLTPPFFRQKFKKLLVKGGVPPSMLRIEKLGGSVNYIKQFKLPSGDVIQKNSYEQLIYTVLPQLLHWEDRNSMAHSLESRVPFLDFRFVEFNLSLSPDLKIADGYTKLVLRGAMSGILPEKIRMRIDKIGFATAEEYWMKGQSSNMFRRLLMEAVESSKEIFTEEALQKFDRIVEGKENLSSFAWRVICFGKWMKIFNVSI